jgi:hypothetical protein
MTKVWTSTKTTMTTSCLWSTTSLTSTEHQLSDAAGGEWTPSPSPPLYFVLNSITSKKKFRIECNFMENKKVTSRMPLIQLHLNFPPETLYICFQILDTFKNSDDGKMIEVIYLKDHLRVLYRSAHSQSE